MTTASVPWLTGTAINPLLRAAHLTAGRPDGAVTLYLPWLEPERQHEVYKDIRFETRGDQARYVAAWVRDTAGMAEAAERLRIAFYDAHYHTPQGSIYPMGRTVEALPRADFRRYDGGGGAEAGAWAPDVVVLEEPEHLNWYSFVDGDASAWRSQGHVVGAVHTHYVSYAPRSACGGLLGELVHPVVGPFKAMMALLMSRWMTNGHCHRIEFGGTLPGGPVHVVGDGLHRHDVARSFAKRKLPAVFHGRRDHAEPLCQDFRVLVNPSKTEVLCTTIAEALAMGKWVVIRKHPSNEFFYDFPTCLPFETKAEFATHYAFALRHEPPPLSDRMRRRLSWAAATDRFCDAAAMPETPLRRHQRLAARHCHMGRAGAATGSLHRGRRLHRRPPVQHVRERQGGGDAPPAAADAPVEVAV
ncbi:digalactosyldiacylglycerol synthase [Aureococcus anophagefferens]|nr:digalactosyldiacylglycerol synthase [Aureococcus anophagefferens]